MVLYSGRPKVLSPVWDHLVPYVYGYDNSDDNFVAACQICNNIKSSKLFSSLEEAREYINARLEAKERKVA
jgi:5-methylcytosine-specific restriction endonuclease McrA